MVCFCQTSPARRLAIALLLILSACFPLKLSRAESSPDANSSAGALQLGRLGGGAAAEMNRAGRVEWTPLGLSGGGGMFAPAISPADPDLMMINCDMSGAYISEDGGANWRMINCGQLKSDTRCRPAFHPPDDA